MTGRRLAIILTVLTAAYLLTGCAKTEYDWIMKIDDKDVPAGIYVMSEMLQYMKAQAETETMPTENETVTDEKIEQRAIEDIKELCFVEQEFEDRELEVTEEAEKAIEESALSSWDNVKEVYEKNGLTYEYYKEYLTYLYKEDLIFEDIYLTDEMLSRNEEEIAEYLNNTISRVSLFCIPLENLEGEKVSDETRNQLMKIALNAKQSLDEGASVEDVACENLPLTAEILGITADFAQGSEYVSTAFVSKSYTGYDDTLKESIFAMSEGENAVFETDRCIYVMSKLCLADAGESYDNILKQAMYRLKGKEFRTYIREGISKYTIEINDDAISFYAPSKIVINVK